MSNLLVRRVDDDLITRRKASAVALERSAAAEHREILRRALAEGAAEVPFDVLKEKILLAPDLDQTPDEIIDIRRA